MSRLGPPFALRSRGSASVFLGLARFRGAATVVIVVSARGRVLAQLQCNAIVAVVVVVCKTFGLAQSMCRMVGVVVGSIRIVAQLVRQANVASIYRMDKMGTRTVMRDAPCRETCPCCP